MKSAIFVVAMLTAVLIPASPGTAAADPGAPVIFADPGVAVPGQYVVMLKSGVAAASVSSTAAAMSRGVGTAAVAEFSRSIRGFAIRTSVEKVRQVARDARVAAIYQDVWVRTGAVQRIPAPPASPWGLDRIDQRSLPLSRSYAYVRGASNVRAYVIDTGIRISHAQFGGRASSGFTASGLPSPGVDCNGHGTHVAGTIGAGSFGVAKLVRLVAVKVFDCRGWATAAQIVEGVNWVTANAVKPAVANMSLGMPNFPPLDAAVAASIRSGVTYVVAAGNNGLNARSFSPARTAAAITVGATGNTSSSARPGTDARAYFSNYGPVVDLFAPGVHIRSAWHLSNSSTNTISGTSMASPHVAGAAALYLGRYPTAKPKTVHDALIQRSTKGKITGAGAGTPNRLLFAYI